jgi:sterol desaturase/sphingolipid hydroxylase (fatty acid hydroxylase superfamily)
MSGLSRDALHLGLIILASVLLIWGVLMAYETWSALTGILVIVVAWVLLSLVHTFVRGEAKA